MLGSTSSSLTATRDRSGSTMPINGAAAARPLLPHLLLSRRDGAGERRLQLLSAARPLMKRCGGASRLLRAEAMWCHWQRLRQWDRTT